MTSVKDIDNKLCCGCLLCKNVCPVNAIHTRLENGFAYPDVDELKCVSCGKCLDYCQVNQELVLSQLGEAHILIAKDEVIYEKSTSGAFFGVVAREFIEQYKGVVVGAAFNECWEVEHIVVSTVDMIERLQGSKYVQSDMDHVYHPLETILQRNVPVLFSGTPCQVAAVRLLFPNQRNLFCIDLVCHGVPSSQIFKHHLESITKNENVKAVAFRTKDKYDKHGYNLRITTSRKETLIPGTIDPFYRMFLKNASLRYSCYYCKYACRNRVGDITIGDCGNSASYHDFHPNQTISTVYINTQSGKSLWSSVSEKFDHKLVDVEYEAKSNARLNSPAVLPNIRNDYEQMNGIGIAKFVNRELGKVTLKRKLKEKMKRMIPESIRRSIQKALHVKSK